MQKVESVRPSERRVLEEGQRPALTSPQVRRDEGGEQREGDTGRERTSIEMRNDEGGETAWRPGVRGTTQRGLLCVRLAP